MDQQPHQLEYATPQRKQREGWGQVITGFGLLAAVAGGITALAGTIGVDNHEQILVGCGLSAFGVICAIQGMILRRLEGR